MSDVLAELLKLLGIVAVPALGYFVRRGIAAFEKRTHITLTEQQRSLVLGAAQRGSGITYDALASYAHGTDPAKVRADAFKAGVDYVRIAAPDAIKALGISDAAIEDMVRGHLGALLASDPAVTVAPVLTAAGNGTAATQMPPVANKAS